MAKETYRYEIVNELSPDLVKKWNQLWACAINANPFNSYEWFLSCHESFPMDAYEFHVFFNKSELVGILPLTRSKKFGIPVISNIGADHLVDTPFLVKTYDKSLFRGFVAKVISRNNIYLHKIDSDAASLLKKINPGIFLPLMSVNPQIHLKNNPFMYVSKSTLSKIKGIKRKNEGNLKLHVYSGWKQTSGQLQTIFKIDSESSKALDGKNIFTNKQMRAFFKSLSKYEDKRVQVHILYYKKVPVLYDFGFLYKKIFIGYSTAYRREYRKINPGKLMISYLLEKLQNYDVEILNMGGGISNYKMEFAKEYNVLYDVYYSQNGVFMSWWKLINKIRRLKQIVKPERNTRDHDFLFKTLSA